MNKKKGFFAELGEAITDEIRWAWDDLTDAVERRYVSPLRWKWYQAQNRVEYHIRDLRYEFEDARDYMCDKIKNTFNPEPKREFDLGKGVTLILAEPRPEQTAEEVRAEAFRAAQAEAIDAEFVEITAPEPPPAYRP